MNIKDCYKIYLIGVGGQGTIKTATIIGEAAMAQGLNAVMSEVHGMAQRGGTVVTEIKVGKANSPLIERNSADLVLAFEPSELLRVLSRIGKDSRVIANRSVIIPFTVSLGISEYPDKVQMFDKLRKEINHLYLIDAEKLARKAGNIITVNMVILGAVLAISRFPVKKEAIIVSMQRNIPAHTVDVNLQALEMGYEQFVSACPGKNR